MADAMDEITVRIVPELVCDDIEMVADSVRKAASLMSEAADALESMSAELSKARPGQARR